MASVLFNGNKLIPAPFFRAQKNYQRNNDGNILGSTWNVTLEGELVSYKGSPDSAGAFWTSTGEPDDEVLTSDENFPALMRKKEALRDLFSSKNDGKLLEIQPDDGSASIKFNPRIQDISFDRAGNDTVYHRLRYSISLEADVLHIVGNAEEENEDLRTYKISAASEDWNLEVEDADLQTYRVSHRVSAVGKPYYKLDGTLEKGAWQHAQSYVLDKIGLGINNTFLTGSGVVDLNSHGTYNYVRSQNVNESNGEFSVTETWLAFHASGVSPAIDTYSVDTRVSQDNGLTTVSVNGSIQGLEERNASTWALEETKYNNAKTYWAAIQSEIYTRATNISEVSNLNPTASTQTIGRNNTAGTINYNYEFNTRGGPIFAGALSEIYQETYDNPADVFASIPIIGRAVGPLLQDAGTTTGRRKRLNISLVFSGYTYGSNLPSKPNTDSLLPTFVPSATTVAKTEDQESWDYLTGRYTRNIGWTYEP